MTSERLSNMGRRLPNAVTAFQPAPNRSEETVFTLALQVKPATRALTWAAAGRDGTVTKARELLEIANEVEPRAKGSRGGAAPVRFQPTRGSGLTPVASWIPRRRSSAENGFLRKSPFSPT